jgi:hypothetical protein
MNKDLLFESGDLSFNLSDNFTEDLLFGMQLCRTEESLLSVMHPLKGPV